MPVAELMTASGGDITSAGRSATNIVVTYLKFNPNHRRVCQPCVSHNPQNEQERDTADTALLGFSWRGLVCRFSCPSC